MFTVTCSCKWQTEKATKHAAGMASASHGVKHKNQLEKGLPVSYVITVRSETQTVSRFIYNQNEYQAIKASYGVNYPKVRRLQKKIAMIEQE